MGESSVCLRHFMNIILLFYSCALTVKSVKNLISKELCLCFPRARVFLRKVFVNSQPIINNRLNWHSFACTNRDHAFAFCNALAYF